MEFGKKYGYTFEHEATYSRICLVNDAVYIAKYATPERCQELYGYVPEDNKDHGNKWTATGTQFAQPYVFKTLFSKEQIVFEDMCETKTVKSSLYLDMNEGYPDVTEQEKQLELWNKKWTDSTGLLPNAPVGEKEVIDAEIAKGHNYHFIGKAGRYSPIKAGCGGGILLREQNEKFYAATGTKGYRWLESEVVRNLHREADIDRQYYNDLVDSAVKDISAFGDFEWFVADIWPEKMASEELPPWVMPCGEAKYATCFDCPHFINCPRMKCELGYDLSSVSDILIAMDKTPEEKTA
jgi:hypothetical protein